MSVIDLFAGPGGWDEGVKPLGIHPIGIEWDADACATGRAAGHEREQADVSALHPGDFGFVDGEIASPPCQGFSPAGKGGGRRDSKLIMAAVGELAVGRDPREDLRGQVEDARSVLVLEPLRWALILRPEWLCWEQVPAVLPLWEACAEALRADGYSVWTGNVQAEQYGVPQTRKRAILIASRNRQVQRPTPTHSRYYARDKARLDPGVLPWVSMAEALGYRPAELLRSNYSHGGDLATRGERGIDEPAFTVSSKFDRNRWLRNGNQPNSAVRHLTEPAPTIHFAARQRMVEWVELEGREPWRWADTPARTITGDPRITAREHHNHGEQNATSYRVTIEEASCLQSFRDGYPWHGTRTAAYRQVGDAVPPRLALHNAAEATGLAIPTTEEVAA